jgi:hypothetical protein
MKYRLTTLIGTILILNQEYFYNKKLYWVKKS